METYITAIILTSVGIIGLLVGSLMFYVYRKNSSIHNLEVENDAYETHNNGLIKTLIAKDKLVQQLKEKDENGF